MGLRFGLTLNASVALVAISSPSPAGSMCWVVRPQHRGTMHKRKQCQAHVSATGTQCKRKAMLGSRYCHLHHSWGKALLGSIVLLLVGAVLRPAAQQIWNNYLPSDDSRILRQLAFERPSF